MGESPRTSALWMSTPNTGPSMGLGAFTRLISWSVGKYPTPVRGAAFDDVTRLRLHARLDIYRFLVFASTTWGFALCAQEGSPGGPA